VCTRLIRSKTAELIIGAFVLFLSERLLLAREQQNSCHAFFPFYTYSKLIFIRAYTPMSTYKLFYFNGRGRAETTRLIFAAAGQKFEDIRYEDDEWPSHKSQMPLGQIPVLEVDGVKLPQSIAIARFVAKQLNLAGKDNLEQAKIDAVADTLTDLLNNFAPILWHEEDEVKKKEKASKFIAEELPKHFKNLEALAHSYGNGGPFFVGNHVTWVDFYAYDTVENLLEIEPNLFTDNPWLQTNRQEVEKLPNISAYLKSRPKTPF